MLRLVGPVVDYAKPVLSKRANAQGVLRDQDSHCTPISLLRVCRAGTLFPGFEHFPQIRKDEICIKGKWVDAQGFAEASTSKKPTAHCSFVTCDCAQVRDLGFRLRNEKNYSEKSLNPTFHFPNGRNLWDRSLIGYCM